MIKVVGKIVNRIITLLLVLALMLIVYIQFFQSHDPLIQFKTVLTGSMTDTYPAGSLLVIRKVEPAKLELNDVITYHVYSEVVSHRIIAKKTIGEQLYFETKGDNNQVADEMPVSAENVIGKVIASVSNLGQFFLIIQTLAGKFALILTIFQLILLDYFLKLLFTEEQTE